MCILFFSSGSYSVSCRNKGGNLITGHLAGATEKEERRRGCPLVGEADEARVAADSRAFLLPRIVVVCGETLTEPFPDDAIVVLAVVAGDGGGDGSDGDDVSPSCCCLSGIACAPVVCAAVAAAWGDKEHDVDDVDFDDVRSVVAVLGEDGAEEQDVSLVVSCGGDGVAGAGGG